MWGLKLGQVSVSDWQKPVQWCLAMEESDWAKHILSFKRNRVQSIDKDTKERKEHTIELFAGRNHVEKTTLQGTHYLLSILPQTFQMADTSI